MSFTYLQMVGKIIVYYADEWKNFLERIGLIEPTFEAGFDKGELSPDEVLKLRLWASYRGQTLARTGMCIYRIIPVEFLATLRVFFQTLTQIS
jgi:hypothetical protein